MFTDMSNYIAGKMLDSENTEAYLLELDAALMELTVHCTYKSVMDATGDLKKLLNPAIGGWAGGSRKAFWRR